MFVQILLILAGALIGGYFTHIFQKKNWLYQKRIDAFAGLIDVIYRQCEIIRTYAFSINVSENEMHIRINQDYRPVRVHYYLASFLLSPEGKKEVKRYINSFEGRLLNYDHHNNPESIERMGFYAEMDELHSILELEISSSWLVRNITYTNLKQQRQKLDLWMRNDYPKILEGIKIDLQKQLSVTKKNK